MQLTYNHNGSMTVTVPAFNATYFRFLMQSKSIVPLQELFSVAQDSAKEWTESMSAYFHLRKHIKDETLVIHVGDGAHCRTGGLFAFHSGHANVSVDPAVNVTRMENWKNQYQVRRFDWVKDKAENVVESIVSKWYASTGKPVLLTFVHAHVDTAEILCSLPSESWKAAYTCACCEKDRQLVPKTHNKLLVDEPDRDWRILSPENTFQMIYPFRTPTYTLTGVNVTI